MAPNPKVVITRPRCAHPDCAGESIELKACAGCFLVLYCGEDCQKRHWAEHKRTCKSPIAKEQWLPAYQVEAREVSFLPAVKTLESVFQRLFRSGTHDLYRDAPAFDILNLPNNEGSDYDQPINILFAKSGDLGNLVKTVASLPPGATPRLKIVLNEPNTDITARNVILLLMALSSKDALATAECAAHYWHSYFTPDWCMDAIAAQVEPLLARYFPKDCSFNGRHSATAYTVFPRGKMTTRTWIFDNHRRLNTHLMSADHHIVSMMHFCEPKLELPDEPTSPSQYSEAMKLRRPWDAQGLGNGWQDIWGVILARLPPGWRPARRRYHQEHFVWPFGQPRGTKWKLNPGFFHSRKANQLGTMPCANPLASWPIAEVMETDNGGADNDVYGKLFYYIRGQFQRFIERLRDLEVEIDVYSLDPVELATGKLGDIKFDRIMMPALSESGKPWLGCPTVRALKAFNPLLKEVSANPHATMLGCYRDWVFDYAEVLRKPGNEAAVAESATAGPHITAAVQRAYSRQGLTRLQGDLFEKSIVSLKDFFESYMRLKGIQLGDLSSQGIPVARKSQHTIIEQEPFLLQRPDSHVVDGQVEPDVLRRLQWECGSGHGLFQQLRYDEWQRRAPKESEPNDKDEKD
ncbi:hypothetical protein F4780DRAFT_187552 [Xylariomycetidae sp. FL0641]|nr:hypothetical protein F4780DRAFT_187552 [Xylariomycetidae sp. FL0641]